MKDLEWREDLRLDVQDELNKVKSKHEELRDKVLEYLDVEATVLSTDPLDLERMQVYTFEWDKVREELRSLARAGRSAPPRVARSDERREPAISRDIQTINRIDKIFRLAIQSEIGNVHAWVERYFVRKEELAK
jgi:hypothetical protein